MKLKINDEISIKYNKDATATEANYKISINNNTLIHCDFLVIDKIDETLKNQAYYRLAGRSDQTWNFYIKIEISHVEKLISELRTMNIKIIKGE